MDWLRKRKCLDGVRLWQSRCGKYRVRCATHVGGVRMQPLVFYAMKASNVTLCGEATPRLIWEIVSRHRVLGRAKAACEQYAQKRR